MSLNDFIDMTWGRQKRSTEEQSIMKQQHKKQSEENENKGGQQQQQQSGDLGMEIESEETKEKQVYIQSGNRFMAAQVRPNGTCSVGLVIGGNTNLLWTMQRLNRVESLFALRSTESGHYISVRPSGAVVMVSEKENLLNGWGVFKKERGSNRVGMIYGRGAEGEGWFGFRSWNGKFLAIGPQGRIEARNDPDALWQIFYVS